jgi:hypothetical protein
LALLRSLCSYLSAAQSPTDVHINYKALGSHKGTARVNNRFKYVEIMS